MKIYELNTEQFIPAGINEAWNFFSSPLNLSKITPPELDFDIISGADDNKIYDGMEILYSVKPLLGIPVKWKTLIKDVDEPYSFTDIQLKGPYKLWEHQHKFTEKENGVLIEDKVRYSLPFGFLGQIIHDLIVRKKVNDIFIFRKRILENLRFGK